MYGLVPPVILSILITPLLLPGSVTEKVVVVIVIGSGSVITIVSV